MRNRGAIVAAIVFAVDQLVKWWVVGPMAVAGLGDVREILPVFALRFVNNCGVSLGLLQADSAPTRWALVVLTTGIALGVGWWMTREQNPQDRVALGLILGGAFGNIADRVLPPGVLGKGNYTALQYPGCVIDYADLHFGEVRPFLVFNIADAAITVGVLILLVRALLVRDRPVEKSDA